MRILLSILFCVFIANAIAPKGAVVTQSVTINSAYVSETATHFNLPFKVPRTDIVAANCDSAKHVALTGSTDTVRVPRWVVFTTDTLFIYADVSKSSSVNTVYNLHFGKTLNEVNSASAFTNCGITSYWGLNEQSGTTVADYANGLTLTVGGGSTLGNAGVFYNALTGGASGYAGISNAVMSGKTAFTLTSIVNCDPVRNEIIYSARTGSTVALQVFRGVALTIDMSGGNSSSISRTAIPNGISYITIVFDGSKTGNSERLKLYVNGILQSMTYTGTIPSSTITYSSLPTFDVGGYRGGNYGVNNIDESCLLSAAVTAGHEADRYKALFTSTFLTLGTPALNELTGSRWSAYKSAFKSAYRKAFK